jgi:hypothetical protein
MAKKYDMAVKTGVYKTQEGLEKGRYESIGEIHPGRDGGFFARLNAFRILGLAMAAVARGDDSILVSLFDPNSAGSQAPPSAAPVQAAPVARQPEPTPTPPAYFDDIPF